MKKLILAVLCALCLVGFGVYVLRDSTIEMPCRVAIKGEYIGYSDHVTKTEAETTLQKVKQQYPGYEYWIECK